MCEVRGGRLVDERRHMDRLERSLGELRIAMPMPLNALGVVLRETVRRNRVRDGIVYLQITRGVARRDHAFPAAGTPPSIVVTARSLDLAKNEESPPRTASRSSPCRRTAGSGSTSKTVSLLPNVLAKQAAREAGAKEAWFVDKHGFVTEGSSTNAWIVTRDGKRGHAAGRSRHPARHHPHGAARRHRRAGTGAGGAPVHGRGGPCGARGLRHLGEPDRDAGGRIDGRPVGNGAPGLVATALRRDFTITPKSP